MPTFAENLAHALNVSSPQIPLNGPLVVGSRIGGAEKRELMGCFKSRIKVANGQVHFEQQLGAGVIQEQT